MKHIKKVVTLALAFAMVLVMSATVFAAGDGSITINNAVSGHTYTAYQIFKGDLSNGKLSNIDWGTGITDAGKTALQTKYDATTASAIAEKIGGTEAAAIAFADCVGTNVTGGKTGSLDGSTYTISGLDDGYYMVVDTYTPSEGEEGVTYSRYMIQLVGTATVTNKAEKPEVDKKIVEGQNKVDANTANIGDTVNYELTSKVPDMTGYKEYYMDFNDTLSKGLTFTAGSVEVTIGGTKLSADDYTVTVGEYSATNGTSIKVHLKDMVSREYAEGADIVVSLKAVVNDAAVIGGNGNPNTVTLDYSNNPANSGDGTPDNDNDGVHGTTPEEVVKTYLAEIELTKVDGKDSTKKLAGAVFNVKGSQINKVIITGEKFVEASDGTYYLLKDGTYTTKEPNAQTQDQYASTETKYKKEAYTTTSVQEAANVDFQVVTGSDGIIKLTGLKDGTYTFTEIQAPEGYNLLSSPITVVVASSIDGTTCTWSTTSTGVTVNDATFAFDVVNNEGSTLPTTGGIGTVLFYVFGSLLVIGCGIVLISRKRTNN